MTTVDTVTTTPMKLTDGTELLGEYQSSGVVEVQHLVRRHDGQLLHIPPLLYAVAASLDGRADLADVAERASRLSGRELSAENVAYLIDAKLRPAGLVASAEATPALPHAAPLLALRFRFGLVPERAHRAVTTALGPLFRAPVVVAALGALVVIDAWLIVNRSAVADAGRQLLYQPQLLLLISALTIVSAVFHETGHATATRYGGATPGVMGAGVYLVWPVFYTDVTDSYRLDRRGRLRTDLGGVYFNVLFTLAAAAACLATGFQPLLILLVLVQLETLQQFLPFVRLDGYYVVSDLVGVPNLFVYMRPVLVLLTRRGTEADRRAAEAKLANLKPWARRTIRAWVFLTAPILLFNLAIFFVLAPAIGGAAWGSVQVQAQQAATAYSDGRVAGLLNGIVALGLLAAPLVGMLYVAVLAASRIARSARRWRQTRPVLVTIGAVAVAGALVIQLGVVWPQTFRSALERSQLEQPAVPTTESAALAAPVPRAVPTTAATNPAPSTTSVAADVPTTVPPPVADPVAATVPPASPPTLVSPAMAVAACGSRGPASAPAAHPERQTWMEEVLCEAQSDAIADQ